ncbi:6-phosphofructokinase [Polystyrenella longa]|uniref:6-phosphofructokinase n=1 Tax=Polystyrenella longa TaxID=2528007 RepID=A0A518CQC6_9PLAN|nr:6-phosphofructokinase [Polystyrenella longa]QDU81421.1 6-phosphofructokinase [Polystyrenella longa]
MRRIAILTAGGDTPALNATIYGAVERSNQLGIEVYGIMKGFSGLLDSRVPHVNLNPLFVTIPEIDPCCGGTAIGASRTYISSEDAQELQKIAHRLKQLKIDGVVCIGGDGTISGMQSLCELFPCVLAPKTIDNDLGLNYINEPNEWHLNPETDEQPGFHHRREHESIALDEIVNYATPGYATAVFVAVQAIERIRTTAESHRRIAIVEVMGRHSGYIALGSAYGQPDMILLPEVPLDFPAFSQRVRELYDRQKNVVIVVGEGIVDQEGKPLGAAHASTDPAGNILLDGAAESLKKMLADDFGSEYFSNLRRHESAAQAIFTRKVGHTQRGGRPIRFDRFYATQLGGKAVDLLVEGQNNSLSTLCYQENSGFSLGALHANKLRDQWGRIHARTVHPSLYDDHRFQPSRLGIDYLSPIFNNAIGSDDLELFRSTFFQRGNLTSRYQSVNVDMQKRIRYLED